MTLGYNFKGVHCLRFDSEDKFIAAGYTDGIIRIFNILSGKISIVLEASHISEDDKFAFPCLRWRPQMFNKPPSILTAVSVEGSIYQWVVPAGKLLTSIKPEMPANDLFCLDYNQDGSKFAVAGKDQIIKIYDEQTKEINRILTPGSQKVPGHSNRIFSLKFSDDPNLILSASWDKTLKIWDLRQNGAVGSILGVEVSGDSIDSIGELIITGSHRSKNSIQTWSLNKFELIDTFCWDESTLIYSLRLSNMGGQYVLIGGSSKNEVRIFDRGSKNIFVCGVSDLPKPCFSVDFSHDTKLIAVGSGDGHIRLFDLVLGKKY